MPNSKETESKLTKIQAGLKVPKDHPNKFGNFMYRNAEDIERELKPLLVKYDAQVYITEEVRQVGEHNYFVDTVKYKDSEQELEVQGWAREAFSKKGMDDAQLSGATSSYAAKYALGKLFLVDDTRDIDSYKNDSKSRKPVGQNKRSDEKQKDAAMRYTIKVANQDVLLVEVIADAMNGNKTSQDVLSELKGKDKKGYSYIVKNKLYREVGHDRI